LTVRRFIIQAEAAEAATIGAQEACMVMEEMVAEALEVRIL
jgi:hypothetical protein